MTARSLIAIHLAAALIVAGAAAQAALGELSAISITLGLEPQVRPIVLNPGFVTTLRFDRTVTHAVVGDPSMVDLKVGGWMGRDLVLKPLVPHGETNLHVWAGEVITLWQVIITTGVPRTPELVLVRIKGRLPPPERLPTVEAKGGESSLSAEISRDSLVAVFSVERSRAGVLVRYRLRNDSQKAYRVSPSLAVVWADGKIVPFTLLREVSSLEPTVLLPGTSESGVFTIMRNARTVRVLLPVYPDMEKGKPPVWFEPIFSGVDRLTVVL